MLEKLKQELNDLAEYAGLREFHVRSSQKPAKITIKDQALIDFTNWDFLNVNQEQSFRRAFQTEVEAAGVGAMAARCSSGTLPAHVSLEKRIVDFLGVESAILFSSVNQAVLSLISAVLGEGDCVIIDEQLMGPVGDAAYLVNAEVVNFDVANPDTLAKAIETTANYKNKIIFTHSVDPISGELIDLKSIVEVASQKAIPVAIDESYALGVVGLRGAGGTEAFDLKEGILCRYSSLGLGLGSYGAFIAGPKVLVSFIMNRSRTFVLEASMPPALAAAAEAAINIVELEPGKREKIATMASLLRKGLRGLGFSVSEHGNSAVVSFRCESRAEAQEIYTGLFHRGFFVEVLSSGYILDSGAVVRFLLNSAHKEQHINDLIQALSEVTTRIKKP